MIFKDINIDFKCIYIEQDNGMVYEINHANRSIFFINTMQPAYTPPENYENNSEDSLYWQKIIQNLTRNHLKLYVDFQLKHTLLYICHGKLISIYDTIENQWRHNEMGGFIVSIFPELVEGEVKNMRKQEDNGENIRNSSSSVFEFLRNSLRKKFSKTSKSVNVLRVHYIDDEGDKYLFHHENDGDIDFKSNIEY